MRSLMIKTICFILSAMFLNMIPCLDSSPEVVDGSMRSSNVYSSFNPIVIDGNSDLLNKTDSFGWGGNGTMNNPILVNGSYINTNSTYGISISNTDLHLFFTNCTYVDSGEYGFFITDSKNISIIDLQIDSTNAIHCVNSEKIFVSRVFTTISYSHNEHWSKWDQCNDVFINGSSLVSTAIFMNSQDIRISGIEQKDWDIAVTASFSSDITIENSSFKDTSITSLTGCNRIYVKNIELENSYSGYYRNCLNVSIRNITSINTKSMTFRDCDGVLISNTNLNGTRSVVIIDDSMNVTLQNNALGLRGLSLEGTEQVFETLNISNNNTIYGKKIVLLKNNDLSPLVDSKNFSQIIVYNLTNCIMPPINMKGIESSICIIDSSSLHFFDLEVDGSELGIEIRSSSKIYFSSSSFLNISGYGIRCLDSSVINVIDSDFHGVMGSYEMLFFENVQDLELKKLRIFSEVWSDAINIDGCMDVLISYVYFHRIGGNCIDVQSTDYLRIAHNTFSGDVGVRLRSSNDVDVIENDMNCTGVSIHLRWGNNNIVIKGNSIISNYMAAISIDDSTGISIHSNEIQNGYVHLNFRDNDVSFPALSENNTIDGKPILHMRPNNVVNIDNVSNYGQIFFNSVSNYRLQGLEISTGYIPMYLFKCSTFSIIKSNFSDCKGVFFSFFSTLLTVTDCIFDNCTYPLSLNANQMDKRSDILINDCIFINCSSTISTEEIISIEIRDSIFSGGRSPIEFYYGRKGIVNGCSFSDIESGFAIRISRQDNCEIRDSKFSSLQSGIYIRNSAGNRIYRNLFYRSKESAISMGSTYGDGCNWISSNIFIENNGANSTYNSSHIQVSVDDSNTLWNDSSKIGNYWSDWTGPDTNGDGFVDEPYIIEGSTMRDNHPLSSLPFHLIGEPCSFSGVSGNGYLLLSWDEPQWNWMSNITGYKIYKQSLGLEPEIIDIEGKQIDYNDTSIENGITYSYSITAENEYDESEPVGPVYMIGDGTPPEIISLNPANGTIFNKSRIEISWICYDDGIGLDRTMISLDGGECVNTGPGNSHLFENLTDGWHSVSIEVFDLVGNKIQKDTSFLVDTISPDLDFLDDLGGKWLNISDLDVEWIGSDETSGVSHYMVSIHNEPWKYYDNNTKYSFNDLVTGPCSIGVKVLDLSGNSKICWMNWSIDVSPPSILFKSPTPNEIIETEEVELSWIVTDEGSGIEFLTLSIDDIDGIDVLNLDKYQYGDLKPGLYSVVLSGADLSGNGASALINFTIGGLPEILEFSPIGIDVPLNATISFTLSRPIGNIDLMIPGISGSTVVDGSKAFFVPEQPLEMMTDYTVYLNGHDIYDLSFNSFNWTFKTIGPGRLVGIVVGNDHESIFGVGVFVNGKLLNRTDRTGSFEIYLDPGKYILDFQMDGYVNKSVEVDIELGETKDLDDVVLLEIEKEPLDEKQEKIQSVLIIIIASTSIVLLILLMIVVIVARKRSKDQSPQEEAFEEMNEEKVTPSDEVDIYSNIPDIYGVESTGGMKEINYGIPDDLME